LDNSKLSEVEITVVVVPLSKLHSKEGVEPPAITSGSVIAKITSSPIQYFRSWLLIVVPESSDMSIGSSKEDINGGSPCVDVLPSKNRASFVKTTSSASAVGFSITSKKVACPLLSL